jgi:hypothetical protein
MEWLLLTLKSLPVLKFFFEKIEQYIITPLITLYDNYIRERIEKKYDDLSTKEDDAATTIDIERSKPDTIDSDEAIRNAHRNRLS